MGILGMVTTRSGTSTRLNASSKPATASRLNYFSVMPSGILLHILARIRPDELPALQQSCTFFRRMYLPSHENFADLWAHSTEELAAALELCMADTCALPRLCCLHELHRSPWGSLSTLTQEVSTMNREITMGILRIQKQVHPELGLHDKAINYLQTTVGKLLARLADVLRLAWNSL